MNRTKAIVSVAALLAGAASLVAQAADEPLKASSRVYDFQALLDDKPIGEHRFDVVVDGTGHRVTSEADFSVKVLGFTVFHYHHHASEQWIGDCLASLSAVTDDDGKPASVNLDKDGDVDRITTTGGQKAESGCLMSYAYWNPALREQTHLLNPETGKVDAVRIERVGTGAIPVGGKEVPATDYRISGGESPIDVWYSDKGEWIGLDSMVGKGRRKLSYRLP